MAPNQSRALEGKVAIVTGASRGLGYAIGWTLASRGASVALTYSSDRSKEAVDGLISKISSELNGKAVGIQCDLSELNAPQIVVDETKRALGDKIDILVNNAAMISGSKIGQITPEHFDEVFHLNVRAPLLMTQTVLPHLRRPGRIINMSSVGARKGYEGTGTYAASKAALEGYTRSWAVELGKDGTTVNAVNPGPVKSEMLDQVPDEIKNPQADQTPVEQRFGTPEEIAEIVAFLADEKSSWVTGQCISASGGYQTY